ncbi:MAG TPA: DNA methyltransferase [Candidatus Diapherotrites archaeon]|nr:DNA methyltransferase [Candidatus Diapherotrites archaeon]
MYLFLLGRDSDLSKLEISVYFKANDINYQIVENHYKYLLIDFKQEINLNKIILELGGITRIAQTFFVSENVSPSFLSKFDFEFYTNFNFSVSSIDLNNNEIEQIIYILKQHFKQEKVKAVYKKPKSENIVSPDDFFSWKLNNNGFELVIVKAHGKYYFSKSLFCFDSKLNVFKDTKRPSIKQLYSTSFRLSQIMINILGLKKGKTILDPFCGAGTFLIQGLCLGYNVIGIDKDTEMCKTAKDNVLWAIKQFNLKNSFKIINGDATSLNITADGVVFEPYMGPFLNKLPSSGTAKAILKQLNSLYFDLFKNLSNNLKTGTRIVCILPEFKTNNNKIYGIYKNVYEKNNFGLVNVSEINKDLDLKNPIFYTTPSGTKINRYIYVLEKL